MSSKNLALLTQSHGAIAAKKRAKRDQIKEVVFDEDARREFLTGFHKRKLAKAEGAKQRAAERARIERLEHRREQRRQLAERAAENAAQVEKACGALIGGDEEDEDMGWDGIEEIVDKGKEKDEEYEDEEQLATVTVVEDFDPHTIIHGAPLTLPPPPPVSHQTIDATKRPPLPARATQSDVTRKKKSGKARTVHYQTKSARKAEKGKQRARRTEKAERAGGNGSARNRIRSKGAHVKRRRN